jgi:hypothetical protein
MALRGQVKEGKPGTGPAVWSEYVISAGTIGKLLFLYSAYFSTYVYK